MALLSTLGRIELEGTELTRPQPLLVLTYLRLEGPVSREHVAQLFWPNHHRQRRNLSMALTRIRSRLDGAVDVDGGLLRSQVPIDAEQCEASFRAGDMQGVVDRYGGSFLPAATHRTGGIELEEWILARRERYAMYACRAHAELARRAIERGSRGTAAGHAADALDLVRTHALTDERAVADVHRLLTMLRSPDATETERWMAELGIDDPAPTASPDMRPASPELVGRDDDLSRVVTMIESEACPIVTLTGPAGVGKTSLAIEVARTMTGRGAFPDGWHVVPLESARTEDDVLGRVATELGVADAHAVRSALRAALDGRRVLLVLDNFEQAVSAACALGEVAASMRGPTFLVTSRADLKLRAARDVALEPLPTIAARPEGTGASPAARLFLHRARRVSPSFDPDEGDMQEIEEICRRLDGLPLAIELAAVHVRAFGPGDILELLEDRFALLHGGFRDAPDRHRSLVAALDWSYELLNGDEKRSLRRLAAFRGSFDLRAAAEVERADRLDVAARLRVLVEHNLVKRADTDDRLSRFRLLDTIRAYGRRRLVQAGERAEVERAHAQRIAAMAEAAAGELVGEAQGEWSRKLRLETENVRAALEWCREAGLARLGLRIATCLWRYWVGRGDLREARAWLETFAVAGSRPATAADGPDAPHDASPMAFEARRALATVSHELGEFETARTQLETLSATLPEGDARRPGVSIDLAWVVAHLGELDRAERLAASAGAAIDAAQDPRSAALAENGLGWCAMYRGAYRVAEAHFRESLRLRRRAADARGVAFAEVNLAWATAAPGGVLARSGMRVAAPDARLQDALALASRAQEALTAMGDDQLTAWAATVRAEILAARGRAEEALGLLHHAVGAWRRVGNRDGLALAHEAHAAAMLASGDAAGASTAARNAMTIRDATANRWGMARARVFAGLASPDAADVEDAAEHVEEALRLAVDLGHRWIPGLCRRILAGGGSACSVSSP